MSRSNYQSDQASSGLVIGGYITAILLPIVGFFVGLVLIVKNRTGHGIATMVISVIVIAAAWSIAFSDDGPSRTEPASSPGVEQVIEEQEQERERADAEFDACVDRLGLDIHQSEKDRQTALDKC